MELHLHNPAPTPLAAPPLPAYIPPFGIRTVVGCLGVLLAVHVAGFNEHITEIGLADIAGASHFGHDEGVWFTSTYEAFNIAAMAFTPWFYVTFSIYRFAIFMTAALALFALPAPFMPDMASLCLLRALQGVASGCLPPILMTVMLKYLPPHLRVFGIGGYAMSATFGPNLGGPLEAVLFGQLGWRWLYWETVPLCTLAVAMMAWGLPRDPSHLERFRQFNWRGFGLGLPGIVLLVTVLYHGERLDWFASPLIVHLTCAGGALFALFIVHEWFHHSPFFRIQFWGNRNIAFALLTLVATLVVCGLLAELPMAFLAEVQGQRPGQIAPVALVVALPQLILLPATAALCNTRRIDCRYVLAIGMGLLALSAFWGSRLSPEWMRGNFYAIQALQVFGEPMVVIPVLMLATMKLGPADGPLISGMVNMMKGLANALTFALLATLLRRRENFHSAMLLAGQGHSANALAGMGDPLAALTANLTPDARINAAAALETFHGYVHEQALTLALADLYLLVCGVALVYMCLTALMPERVFPPSPPAAQPAPTLAPGPDAALPAPALLPAN
ncbi:MAG TPA: MFS transporter [Novosphingobium sp.]|nr:MFS transporter [Novosphingobium sp.]